MEFKATVITFKGRPNLNADARQLIEQQQREDPNTYSDFSSLVERLQRIEARSQGTMAKPSKDEIMSFYKQELSVGKSIPMRRHPKPVTTP